MDCVGDAALGVQQYDGEFGGRRAGGHVARVLLMARRVGQNELALGRREIAIGDVDGDALLALGAQAVGEQRKIDLAAADRPASVDLRKRRARRATGGRSAWFCRRRRCPPW